MNAVQLAHPRTGETLRVVVAVSYTDELTLDMALSSLRTQTVPTPTPRVLVGLSPMCTSFNAALDYACDEGADVLLHTGADVIAEPNALESLLDVMDLDRHYLSVGSGFDILNGPGSRCGLWVFNMRILGRSFRFRDVFKQDLELCGRVESSTGTARVYTPSDLMLGYHDPIWTPRRLWLRLAYSAPKYDAGRPIKYRRFLEGELAWNPGNKVLLCGLRALDRVSRGLVPSGSKRVGWMQEAYAEDTADLRLSGGEYYVYHWRFKFLAQQILRTPQQCLTVEERTHTVRPK